MSDNNVVWNLEDDNIAWVSLEDNICSCPFGKSNRSLCFDVHDHDRHAIHEVSMIRCIRSSGHFRLRERIVPYAIVFPFHNFGYTKSNKNTKITKI